jgi:L-glutamine---4-(methylsulfanyl)-2-oxobutanoate aminotransferase
MKNLNSVVESFSESIFSTYTKLANENQAINLAQGFPDFDGPEWILKLASNALYSGKNQYAPSMGLLTLREALSELYQKNYNLKYRAQDEILITNGATEAIYSTITALVNPGDEVVVFEPFYDSYLATLKLCGAKVRVVTLRLPNFHYDLEELKKVVNEKTKLIIINNPHNPTGKVFTANEISEIGELARKYDSYILSDEVYEYLSYSSPHKPTASYDDLKDRVITISSIGKTFSLTGWKIGWAMGPSKVIHAIHHTKQFISFCTVGPLQEAFAQALPKMDEYLSEFKTDYARKRDLLCHGLKNAGYEVIMPQGTYFALVVVPDKETDLSYCSKLITDKKVATIPTSAFYMKSDEGKKMIRFCFAKKDETLNTALARLKC